MLEESSNTNGYKWAQKLSIVATIYALLITWLLVLYFPEVGSPKDFHKGKSKNEEYKNSNMAKKKMYISLPITGFPIDEVKKKAETLKSLFCKKYEVVTPFDVCPEQNKSYAHYMGKDIEALLECDIIYMSPGWVHSKGCNAEYQIAKIYGIEIKG